MRMSYVVTFTTTTTTMLRNRVLLFTVLGNYISAPCPNGRARQSLKAANHQNFSRHSDRRSASRSPVISTL